MFLYWSLIFLSQRIFLRLNQKVKYAVSWEPELSGRFQTKIYRLIILYIKTEWKKAALMSLYNSLYTVQCFSLLHFSSSHVNVTLPIQSLLCQIRGIGFYFLTIWMTSSCSMMCVSPTLWGLYLVLVPWKKTVNNGQHPTSYQGSALRNWTFIKSTHTRVMD